MKNQIVALSIIVLCFYCSAFQVQPNECSKPLIVQYIQNYKMQRNDLQTLIEKSQHPLKFDDMNYKDVKFSSIIADLKYINGSQKSDNISLLKVNITNDAFSISLTWDITVSKIASKNHFYHAKVQATTVSTSYLKQFLINQKKFNISNFQVNFKEQMIEKIVYNDTMKKKDEDNIKYLVKNDFYNKILDKLNNFTHGLQDVVAKQRIARAYSNNIYQYEFEGTKINIDTTTLTFTVDDDNVTLVNGYNGMIAGLDKFRCPDSVPVRQSGYGLYISDSFIDNFVNTCLKTHQGYQKVVIDSKFKIGNFQWKLLDLEFVLEDFGNYEDKILNNINFVCSVRPDFSLSFKQNLLTVFTTWDCKGNLEIAKDSSIQIIDSTYRFHDSFVLNVQDDRLRVSFNNRILDGSEYRQVSDLKVKDSELADRFVQYLIKDMKFVVIGDQFRIEPASTKVKVEENKVNGIGIWIG